MPKAGKFELTSARVLSREGFQADAFREVAAAVCAGSDAKRAERDILKVLSREAGEPHFLG